MKKDARKMKLQMRLAIDEILRALSEYAIRKVGATGDYKCNLVNIELSAEALRGGEAKEFYVTLEIEKR